MDSPLTERRSDVRGPLDAAAFRATLRPGCSVLIIDASPRGALVQAAKPLRPGTRVHLQVSTENATITVVARVLRCVVWALHPLDGAIYRGALVFDERCDLLRELATHGGTSVPGRAGPIAGGRGHRLPAAAESDRDDGFRSSK